MATKLLKCIKALCRASGDTVHGGSLISSFVQGLNKAESVVPFLCFDEATSLPQFLCYPGSCQDNKSEIARGVLIQLGFIPFRQSMCHAGDAHGLYLVYSRTVT